MKRWYRLLPLLLLFLLTACMAERPAGGEVLPSAAAVTAGPSMSPAPIPAPERTAPPKPESSAAPAPAPTPDVRPTSTPVPTPEPPENPVLTCTLSVSCAGLLDSEEGPDPELLPADGVILAPSAVEFQAGESVFDVLKRTLRDREIHLEFVLTPGLGSAYIEGIANIYEFDGGPLSGWMYRVNGAFPGVACSSQLLEDGDQVEWLYTLDLGRDVGGNFDEKE